MNNEPITLKEFVVIMIAGAMITTALYTTNTPPARTCAPIYLGQTLQMGGTEHQDYSQAAYWGGNDSYFTEHVAPPQSGMSSWNCGWGTWWSKMTHALGGGFWRVYQN